MRKTCDPSSLPGATGRGQFAVTLKRFSHLLVVVGCLLALWPARAAQESEDEQYLRLYSIVQEGDSLQTIGQTNRALAKYHQAQAALQDFQREHRDWNPKIVSYRLGYLAKEIAALTGAAAPPPKPAAASQNGAAQPKPAVSTSATQVKLLDPGAEPRQLLRYHPKAGDTQTITLTLKMALESQLGDTAVPAMKLPPMNMTMQATVKSVAMQGDITYQTLMTDAGVSDDPSVMPQVAAAMKAAFPNMKGISGTGTISSRGFVKTAGMKMPPGTDPQTRQVMDQMKEMLSQATLRLPEEAVGTGAKWEVSTPIKAQGMALKQTATYQLVSLDGDRLTAKATISQHAAKQRISIPAMPSQKMDLIKMEGQGTGEISLNLAQLFPTQATTEFHSDSAMAGNVNGQKQTMTAKVDVNVRFESK